MKPKLSLWPWRRATLATLLACLLAGTALSCGTQQDRTARDVPLAGGRVAREVVLIQDSDKSIQVEYRTSLSVRDGQALRCEVRDLWAVHVRAEAERLGVDAVLIWPTDDANAMRSYYLTRDGSGQWKDDAGFQHCP